VRNQNLKTPQKSNFKIKIKNQKPKRKKRRDAQQQDAELEKRVLCYDKAPCGSGTAAAEATAAKETIKNMCICCSSTASTKLEPDNRMTYKTPKGEFHGSDHSIKNHVGKSLLLLQNCWAKFKQNC
jgi:hypothetical protein